MNKTIKTFVVLVFISLVLTIMPGCGGGAEPSAGTGVVTAVQSGTSSTETVNISTLSSATLYTFAVCGDNRTEGIMNGVFPRILASAKEKGAAFLVDTGDVSTTGSRDQLDLYTQLADGSGLKVYTVPGNHDVGKGGVSDTYTGIIGTTYYSFDFGGDHFVIVDNADDATGIDDTQMQWLENDLSSNAVKPRQFIFAHIPVADPSLPSSHVSGESGGAGLSSGQRMVDDAHKYPDVSDFFFGHIHAYLAYKLDGIDAYVTGGAGAPLYFPEGSGGYYHYLLVTVRTGGVDVEVVRV